jgi:multiple antibiotic resistance protein
MLPDQQLLITQLMTLWAVLDPISHLSLFMAATAGLERVERRRAAFISVLLAFAVLAFFGLAGQFLLHAMGISLLSFQIAGGIVLLLFGLSMVLGEGPQLAKPQTDLDAAANATARRDTVMSVAVFPLATPIIAGPGAILTMVLLMDNNRFSYAGQTLTIASLAIVLAALLVIFLAGHTVERLIGKGGIQLLRRIMGLLLSALAINLVLSAVASWLKLPPI